MGNNISDICSCNTDSNRKSETEHIVPPLKLPFTSPLDDTRDLSLSNSKSTKCSSRIDIRLKLSNTGMEKSYSDKENRKDSIDKDKEIMNDKYKKQLETPKIIEKNKISDEVREFDDCMNSQNIDNEKIVDKITYEDGSMYIGEQWKGMKHGEGKIIYSQGSSYQGNFFQDMYEGKGKLITENDTIYEGFFSKGKRNGHGIQYNKSGTYKYDGEWKEGVKNGYGKENYPDGSIYEGLYLEGKKNGIGKIVLSNGYSYEGEFKDDQIEGKGTFKWSETQTYTGSWKFNCLSGFGCFRKGDQLFKGYFYNDKKHGLGIKYYLESLTFVLGCWTDNMLDGLAIFHSPEQDEQFWLMKRNKVIRIIEDEAEIEQLKKTEEYAKLEEFWEMVKKT